MENEQSVPDISNVSIKTELLNTISSFINEIDLVFDNIDKNVISKLNDFLNSITNHDEEFNTFIDQTHSSLSQFQSNLTYIMTTKQKLKTLDFSFLDDICLFQDLLHFKIFSIENKNTKRSIVKYLYNICMFCVIFKFGTSPNSIPQEQILNFISLNNQQHKNDISPQKTKPKKHYTKKNSQDTMTNIFESLMSNNEIMNIATDLSKDIQSQDIDPMMILSSLMSGKPNSKIQNLVNNITNKLEQKINNGEINKDLLEEQAKNIMNTVQSNDIQDLITSQLPNLLNQNQK